MSHKDKQETVNTNKRYNVTRDRFETFKVKIPKTLPRALCADSKLRTQVDTWLIIKSIYEESGRIELNRETRADLSNKCMCSIKTFTRRVKELHALGLLEYRKHTVLICAWDHFADHFKLKDEPNYKLRFYFVKYNGTKRISDILEMKFMEAKEQECKRTAYFKLNINSVVRNEVAKITGGETLEAVLHSQLYHYLHEFRNLDQDEKFLLYNIARADTALSYRKWSQYFDLSSKGGFAYKKRKLIKAGLIVVVPRAYVFDKGTHTTRALRKCILGTAPRINGQTVFQLPDQVIYLSPSPVNIAS